MDKPDDRRAESDLRFEEAKQGIRELQDYRARTILLALAYVSAIREQTEVLRQLLAVQERIARQLERRDIPVIIQAIPQIAMPAEDAERLGQKVAAVLGEWSQRAFCMAEGGGEGGG